MRIVAPDPAGAESGASSAPAAQAAALKVLLVVGHPRKASFCGALARAYRKGAARGGVEVRELWLADLRFDRDVRSYDPALQPVEKDLRHARELIAWADHLTFVYPTACWRRASRFRTCRTAAGGRCCEANRPTFSPPWTPLAGPTAGSIAPPGTTR